MVDISLNFFYENEKKKINYVALNLNFHIILQNYKFYSKINLKVKLRDFSSWVSYSLGWEKVAYKEQ